VKFRIRGLGVDLGLEEKDLVLGLAAMGLYFISAYRI